VEVFYFCRRFRGERKFEESTATAFWDQSKWDDHPGLLAPRVFLKDLNGDGFPDLVVSGLYPMRGDDPEQFPYPIALNDGHGHFTPMDTLSLPSFRGRHLWPIDAFGDGRTDLVGLSLLGEMQGNDFFTYGASLDIFESTQTK
jgi:hypothetical protein